MRCIKFLKNNTIKWCVFCGCCFFATCDSSLADLNCTYTPDCTELGYTKDVSECQGVHMVLCPTDLSKAFCTPKVEPPFLLIYGDGTISEDIIPDKKLIGISYDTERKLAILVPSYTSLGTSSWANKACDYISDNCFANSDFNTCGADGVENTLNFGSCFTGSTYAYRASPRVDGSWGIIPAENTDLPSGDSSCTADFCKHRTFMPSMKDLLQIQALFQKLQELPELEKPVSSKYITDVLAATFWTSTEFDTQYMLGFDMTKGPVKLPKEGLSEKYSRFNAFSYDNIGSISCEVGSILGGNGLCYKADLPANVSPVGIVFDTNKRLAVAISPIGFNSLPGKDEIEICATTYCSYSFWIGRNDIITDTMCSDVASCPTDGRKNTDNLLSFISATGPSYETVALTNSFSPDGCTAEFCKQGKWFVPSISELQTIAQNRAKIGSVMWWLFGNDPFAGKLRFWSSNQAPQEKNFWTHVWYWHFDKIFEYGDAGSAKQSEDTADENVYTLPVVAY